MPRAERCVIPEFGGKTEVNRENFLHSVVRPNRDVATDIQTDCSLGYVSAEFESRWEQFVYPLTQTSGESLGSCQARIQCILESFPWGKTVGPEVNHSTSSSV